MEVWSAVLGLEKILGIGIFPAGGCCPGLSQKEQIRRNKQTWYEHPWWQVQSQNNNNTYNSNSGNNHRGSNNGSNSIKNNNTSSNGINKL